LFQKQNTVFKTPSLDCHNKVDGVEVLFTSETPGQVRDGMGRRLELMADRAQKTKNTFADF
jgi:hypothetical protein